MTIAYVSDAVYPYNKGGKEKRLYEISTRLAATRHDVHIYTMHWWEDPEKTRVEDGVTLHAICKKYPLYKGEVRSMKQAVMFGLACLKLGNVKCDVMDVDHMPYFPIFGTWLSRIVRGRKIHGTWHEALSVRDWVHYMGLAGYIAALLERIAVQLPYAIIVASPHTMSLMPKYLHRQRRLHLAASGIDIKLIESVRPSRVKTDILSVGRLVKDKNHALLIEAVELLVKDNPGLTCRIVGRGPEKENLIVLIKNLKLQKNVELIDHLPEARDVYAYMKSARVFALPSTREGFGIVALESLACGTPVVTVDSPANGAQTIIRPGKDGRICARSPAAFAAAISNLLEYPVLTNTIAKNPYVQDWSVITIQQFEVYR